MPAVEEHDVGSETSQSVKIERPSELKLQNDSPTLTEGLIDTSLHMCTCARRPVKGPVSYPLSDLHFSSWSPVERPSTPNYP